MWEAEPFQGSMQEFQGMSVSVTKTPAAKKHEDKEITVPNWHKINKRFASVSMKSSTFHSTKSETYIKLESSQAKREQNMSTN